MSLKQPADFSETMSEQLLIQHHSIQPLCLSRLEAQQQEARALQKTLAGLRCETERLNGLLADAAGQREALREDNVALEGKLAAELKVGCTHGVGVEGVTQ
jgi:hypothetical protein